jgi:hypothetical protein
MSIDEESYFEGFETAHDEIPEKDYKNLLVLSSWGITINSNKLEHHGVFDEFIKLIKRLFLSRNIVNFITMTDKKGGEFRELTVQDVKDNVDKVESSGAMEVGEVNQMLHCHFLVQIYHYNLFRLDYVKIREWIIQESQGRISPKVGARPLRIAGTASRRYQNKKFKKRITFRVVSEVRLPDGSELYYDSQNTAKKETQKIAELEEQIRQLKAQSKR